MALEIKKIHVGSDDYALCDEYARQRIEGLATIYSISCEYTKGASDTFVDYDTEADVAYSTMTIMNSKFKSLDKDITIKSTDVTAGTNAYIVLLITKETNKYYVKKLTNLTLGDTIYVKEDATVCADRWLSSWTESPLSGTFTALDAKIDLSAYALKSVAAKAGTYTTTAPSSDATGSAGAETADVTISGIKYDKANANTGLAGGATVSSALGGAVSIAYTPEGTVSQPTFSAGNAASAGAHTHSVSVTGEITLGDLVVSPASSGTVTYTPAGTISKPDITTVASGTASVNTDAIKAVTSTFNGTAATISISGNVTGTAVADHEAATLSISGTQTIASHSHTVNATKATTTVVTGVNDAASAGAHEHSVDSHAHGDNVTVVTGVTAASLGGTTSFNTDAIKSAALASDTATTPAFAFNTDAIKSAALTGTTSFNTDAIKSVALSASTTSTDGPAYIADVSHTAASASSTATVITGYPNFSGGSASGTFVTSAIKSISGTKNYGFSASVSNVMSAPTVSDAGVLSWTTVNAATQDAHTGDAASTGSVSWTAASLGTAATTVAVTGISGGSISKTTKYMKVTPTAASVASVGITTTAATKAGVKVTTANASKGTVTISGGVASGTASVAGVPAAATLTAASAGAHTHAVGAASTASITYVTGATLAKDGSATISGTNFTAALPALTHAVTDGSFSGSTAYTPAGTISNTYTNAAKTTVLTSVSASLASTPEFTGTGVRLQAAGGSVSGSMSGTAASAGAHTHSVSGTVSQPTFTGASVTLSQASHSHSVTIADHSHSIGSTSTAVTGSASAAISAHTHTLGNHTHSVTVPNCNS